MQSKKVVIEGVGEILLERSTRARYVNLTVRPFRGIRVAVPPGVSFQKAAQVARCRSSWLRRMLQRAHQMERRATPLRRQQPVCREKAKKILVGRLQKLAEEHGFQYNRVFIRSQRTRWGSCSCKNNINLNTALLHLPDDLIDYVMLHELVHTRVKNHSAAFWKKLAAYIDNPQQVDKHLDQYWPLLVMATV
jgi:predicted metal-dependent hydrolase